MTYLYQQADADGKPIDEHIAGCFAEATVKGFATIDADNLEISAYMQRQVADYGQDAGSPMPIGHENYAEQAGGKPAAEVEQSAAMRTEAHYQCVFPSLTVCVAVAVVVYQQEAVYHEPAGH